MPSFISIDITVAVIRDFILAERLTRERRSHFISLSRHGAVTSTYNYRGLVNKFRKQFRVHVN